MIFAAGFGRRLLPLTKEIPKALIEVGGRPLLDLAISRLVECGATRLMVNAHYWGEKIVDFINASRYADLVEISREPHRFLGTGGGLYRTQGFWDDDFIAYNVDILCGLDLKDFMRGHKRAGSVATLAVNDRESSSMLLVDEEGFLRGVERNGKREIVSACSEEKKNGECVSVREITEKKNRKHENANAISGKLRKAGFGGIHAISPAFFSISKPPVEFSIVDQYLKLIRAGASISTHYIGDTYWEDVGTLKTLAAARSRFSRFRAPCGNAEATLDV